MKIFSQNSLISIQIFNGFFYSVTWVYIKKIPKKILRNYLKIVFRKREFFTRKIKSKFSQHLENQIIIKMRKTQNSH